VEVERSTLWSRNHQAASSDEYTMQACTSVRKSQRAWGHSAWAGQRTDVTRMANSRHSNTLLEPRPREVRVASAVRGISGGRHFEHTTHTLEHAHVTPTNTHTSRFGGAQRVRLLQLKIKHAALFMDQHAVVSSLTCTRRERAAWSSIGCQDARTLSPQDSAPPFLQSTTGKVACENEAIKMLCAS
jgi:hypothetical protein